MTLPLPERGYRQLRAGRWSESGRIYLLTTVTAGRARLFVDFEAARFMSRLLAAGEGWGGASLLCWVLMPDHWHAIIELAGDASLATIANRIKGRTARRFNQAMRRRGPVWAAGFHDRALRREQDLLAMARYVIANPVRAGLVARVGDYPYWDARWLDGSRA